MMMKVDSQTLTIPNLYSGSASLRQARLVTGTAPAGMEHYRVEISQAGKDLAAGLNARQLPVGAVIHDLGARPYFTEEIDQSLNRVLNGKPKEVQEAVNYLIGNNLMPDGTVSDEGERAALLESGLSQAQFIADNYMAGDEAGEFLAAVNQIAAYARTRTVDPETGRASYLNLHRKPEGAPDDYIDVDYMMKRYDPEAAAAIAKIYANLHNGTGDGSGIAGIMAAFTRKMAENPQWIEEYRAEAAHAREALTSGPIDNRFAGANTANMASFLSDMNDRIRNSAFENTDFLSRNLEYFAMVLRPRS